MNYCRRPTRAYPLTMTLILACASLVAPAANGQARPTGISDSELVRSLQGFKSGDADVNGLRLHYV